MSRSKILLKFRPDRENLLFILHDLQKSSQYNFISNEDITDVANYLNITRSSVYGVITYYTMFSLKPRGKFVIRVCSSPVCEMSESDSILGLLKRILSVETGGTSADGLFTLETSECLGQCSEAPGMMINDRFFGNLNPDSLNKIIDQYRTRKNDR